MAKFERPIHPRLTTTELSPLAMTDLPALETTDLPAIDDDAAWAPWRRSGGFGRMRFI